MWGLLHNLGLQEIGENSTPGEWHLWLQRETGVAVIQKMLQMMFSVKKPGYNEKFKNEKNMP